MPFVSLSSQDLRLFYVCNPIEDVGYESVGPEPHSAAFDANKPTIVLLHSSLTSIGSWRNQLADPRLRSSFNMLALDAPLHGRSEGYVLSEDIPYTLEDHAALILEALDKLGMDSYTVFGESSLGCYAATYVAQHRPDKVKSLVLASPCPHVQSESSKTLLDKGRMAFLRNKPGNGGDESGAIPVDSVVEVSSPLGTSALGKNDRLEDRRNDYRAHLQARYGMGKPAHDLDRVMRCILGRTPIPPNTLSKIAIPVLLFEGSDDKVLSPIGSASVWASLFTAASGKVHVHTIEGAPHNLVFTDSNVVNRVVTGFVHRTLGN